MIADEHALNDALETHGGLAILYESKPHAGHWVLITKRGPNHLEFLDSYGLAPDEQLDEGADYSEQQGNGQHVLASLLEPPDLLVDYLGSRIQEWIPGVNTCGRYAILRWMDPRPSLAGWLRKYGFRASTQRANDERVIELTSRYL